MVSMRLKTRDRQVPGATRSLRLAVLSAVAQCRWGRGIAWHRPRPLLRFEMVAAWVTSFGTTSMPRPHVGHQFRGGLMGDVYLMYITQPKTGLASQSMRAYPRGAVH